MLAKTTEGELLNSFVRTTLFVGWLVVIVITMAITVVIIVIAAPCAYAQNTTTAPATNYTNTTMQSISKINATIIINAINAKVKLIYDGEKLNNATIGNK